MPPSDDLPYVIVNMVGSVDGRSSAGGKASGIGGRPDRGAMRALRGCVDAVMVGAGTLRAERLNLGLDDPEARQPLAVIVGGSGHVPVAERLILPPGQRVLLALPEGRPRPDGPGRDRLTVLRVAERDAGRVELGRLLRTLRAKYGVRRLLVEGGPGLNRALVEAGLVDEIFLTVVPKLLLGREAAIISGERETTPAEPRALTLLSVHSAEGEIFLRYRLQHPKP